MAVTWERKELPLIDAVYSDEGNGTLSGYASVKNNIDSYGDIIRDGAYRNLGNFIKTGWSGFNHTGCVGAIMEAREDAKGLYVNIQFHSTPDAQEIRTKAKERLEWGKQVGMSILYRTLESTETEMGGKEVRELYAIEIKEAGFVLLPANEEAESDSVKSGSGTPLDTQVKQALELCSDLITRFEFLKTNRKNGLSDARKSEAKELAEKLLDLAADAPDETPSTATPEQINEVEQLLAAAGVI